MFKMIGEAEKARDFTVATTKEEVVAAALPLQEHWLPLSNLDLLLPPVDVSIFLCYSNINHSQSKIFDFEFDFFPLVKTLKKALAEVLVSYYAFAGEVATNSTGEPELLCNNRGVDFIEAHAEVELQHLNLYNPDESIAKLVPKKKRGVIAIQATELRCGSMVVGCTFDHRIADAYSANMFLVSWAELSRYEPLSLVPSFRRSLLNPRRPLNVDVSLDQMYVPFSSLPPPKEASDNDALTSRIYYIEADVLKDLQKVASLNGCLRTKLESFSALLWKLVAKHASGDSSKVSKLGVVVDGRTRVDNQKTLMEAYFGNVLSIPYGGQKVNDLRDRPLSWVASEVHKFLANAISKDHFLGLIDWVEAHRPKPMVSKIYSIGSNDGPAFVVSSGQRFPVDKVDFGWGPPVFGSYHFPWGGSAGYVMPMPSTACNGDWVVYLHLTKGQLDLIEEEAADVFKPVTGDYLKLSLINCR